ncbi:SWIRM domain-containing protein [Cardiosporidium cionae]|uniref:SWIRM domain-containing protein n=1 Tax=Cardiosporidium cionae TaxID=476202 RepID=A0ABQ7J761_9APIC|nr:SWIRM domain-containing protein [Cardiosporidium cionae]|eukprot:KAF8819764.1 SWIRM domain-containing protein [Cardiosporidium cionae]
MLQEVTVLFVILSSAVVPLDGRSILSDPASGASFILSIIAMSGRGKPHGPADQKNAQTVDERTVRKYDAVVQRLLKFPNMEKETLCSSEACAKIVAQIQIFMDQKLGYKAKPEECFMTKIPAKFFRDYSDGGSLECTLRLALQFRHDMQMVDGSVLRRFELLSEKQKLCARSLCLRLRDGLKEGGFLKAPVIYLWDDIPADLMERLRDIVVRHEGSISTDIKSASHIVLQYTAKDTEDNETYAREIFREGNRSFAHWWYYPESWDCWTSALAIPEQESQGIDIPPDGKWKVGYDWLLDLDIYNEWMCELDYEIFDHPPRLLDALAAADGDFTLASSKAISKNRRSFRRKVKHTTVYESGESFSEDTETRGNNPTPPGEISSGVLPSPPTGNLSAKLPSLSSSTPSGTSSILRSESASNSPISGMTSGMLTRSNIKEGNTSSAGSMGILPAVSPSARCSSQGSYASNFQGDLQASPPFVECVTAGHSSSFSPIPAFSTTLSEEEGSDSPTSKRKRLLSQDEAYIVEDMSASTAGEALGVSHSFQGPLSPPVLSMASREASVVSFSGEKQAKRARNTISSPVATQENEREGEVCVFTPANLTEISPSPAETLQTDASGRVCPAGPTLSGQPPWMASVRSVPLPEGGVSIAGLQDPLSLVAESATLHADTVVKDTQTMPSCMPREGQNVEGKEEDSSFAHQFLSEKEDETAPFHIGKGTDSIPLSPSKRPAPVSDSLGEIVKQPASENVLASSALLSRDRVTLLNISNLSQEVTAQGILLKTIPLGTPPDRPPLAEKDEKPFKEKETHTEEAGVGTTTTSAEPSSPYVLPTCSRWFDFQVVNAIERNQLSSLFSGSSISLKEKEHSYKLIRNTIVAAYRQNPQRYLSATECRKLIDGDAALILRLHSFLDYWGIINFQADPTTIPCTHLRNKDFQLSQTHVSSGFSNEKTGKHMTPQTMSKDGSTAPTHVSKGTSQNVLQDVQLGKEHPHSGGGPWKCASCGKLCLYSYYVLRPSGITGISLGVLDKCVWCLKCFADGRYPPVLTDRHFLKVDIPIAQATGIDGEWSAKEVEKLIEGIELFKDNWDAVALHIGTGKTPHQCVSFFISIPIKEPFMNASPTEDPSSSLAENQAVPFRTMSNPLMAQLAFLASIVHPKVAACAAKAAFDSLIEAGTSQVDTRGESNDTSKDISILSPSPASLAEANSQESPSGREATPEVENASQKENMDTSKDAPSASSPRLPEGYLTDVDIQVACSTAIAAAAVRAEELATIEENEIRKLLPQLVDLQLQKVELKKQRFDTLENEVAKEKLFLEKRMESLFSEWFELKESIKQKNSMNRRIVASHGLHPSETLTIRPEAIPFDAPPM